MDGKRLIEKIRLRNILSFGDKGEEIELQSLNIIIGQNASGKSNFIDVIKLLHSLPNDRGFINFISRNGGISGWIWKGGKLDNQGVIDFIMSDSDHKVRYEIILQDYQDQTTSIVDEEIEDLLSGKIFQGNIGINFYDSILSPNSYENDDVEAKKFLRRNLSRIVAYTNIDISRKSEIRKPQFADVPSDYLYEDGTNLFLVLNDFDFRGGIKNKVIDILRRANPNIEDYTLRISGGTVQFFIREKGLDNVIGITRISNGTLQMLCLLAILCHPEPPPLICIEEPETGLHPDILPTIAELMKEASQRTQLIVTTHSDILVSAFSDMPEAVLVCEKDEDGTHFKRLEAEKLKTWLEEYTLGEAWLRGAIGGTRW